MELRDNGEWREKVQLDNGLLGKKLEYKGLKMEWGVECKVVIDRRECGVVE